GGTGRSKDVVRVAQVAFEGDVLHQTGCGVDLHRGPSGIEYQFHVDELGVHQLGVTRNTGIEKVGRVIGGEPGRHKTRVDLPPLELDIGQLVQRTAVADTLAGEGRGLFQDRLMDPEGDRRQVRPPVRNTRRVGNVPAVALLAEPVGHRYSAPVE